MSAEDKMKLKKGDSCKIAPERYALIYASTAQTHLIP